MKPPAHSHPAPADLAVPGGAVRHDIDALQASLSSLQWDALCYVLGEMTSEVQAQFELRLLDDLAACDAVAEASRMVMVVAQVPVSPVPVRPEPVSSVPVPASIQKPVRRRSMLQQSWLAGCGLTTAAAVVLFLWNGLIPQDQTLTGDEARMAATLLRNWRTIDLEAIEIESDQHDTIGSIGRSLTPETGLHSLASSTSGQSHDADDRTDEHVPDWMFAALMASEPRDRTDNHQAPSPESESILPRATGVIQ